MPNQKDLNLEKYEISKYRYRELKNFCLQYDEKKQRLAALRGLGAVTYSNEAHSGEFSNPTASKAERAQQLAKDIELIEQTAYEVGKTHFKTILLNITSCAMPYEKLQANCGKRQFYEMRRMFFISLDSKLKRK